MTKPFNIPKALIWEAFKKVKENGGAPGVDHESLWLDQTALRLSVL